MNQNEEQSPKPTEAELDLLQILWQLGPSTVAQIHGARNGKKTGYTTTLKLLQRMTSKGLVDRDETHRSHVYSAAAGAEQTQRQLVKDLLQRAFGGSPGKLVVQALSEDLASDEELAEIRDLIEQMQLSKQQR